MKGEYFIQKNLIATFHIRNRRNSLEPQIKTGNI